MQSQVIVSWDETRTYAFAVDAMPNDSARAWLDQQFTALDCEPIRLSGKVLLADKVLAVAQAAGAQRFADPAQADWAHTYARAAAGTLLKPVIRVDLAALTVGY